MEEHRWPCHEKLSLDHWVVVVVVPFQALFYKPWGPRSFFLFCLYSIPRITAVFTFTIIRHIPMFHPHKNIMKYFYYLHFTIWKLCLTRMSILHRITWVVSNRGKMETKSVLLHSLGAFRFLGLQKIEDSPIWIQTHPLGFGLQLISSFSPSTLGIPLLRNILHSLPHLSLITR